MLSTRLRSARAFSLIELVIVVVIIGIIAAIAVPRMSRGAAGASDSALSANLAVIRNALDLFQAEHGGTYPKLTDMQASTCILLEYSDATASQHGVKDATKGVIYGPYLRTIPVLPVGADKGKLDFVATYTAGHGWVYDETTGRIIANCPDPEVDAMGKKYNSY